MDADAERAGFMAKILAEPFEDTHRLVYADWLEEHGEAARAAFIRVQCELTRPPRLRAEVEAEAARKFTAKMSRLERGDPNLRNFVALPKHRAWVEYTRQREGLITRSRQLSIHYGMKDLPKGWEVWPTPFLPTQSRNGHECRGPAGCLLRGFVSDVRLPAVAFTEDAARGLFSRHPVTRVVLTDREPFASPNYDLGMTHAYGWCDNPNFGEGRSHLGLAIWLFLPSRGRSRKDDLHYAWYPTRDAALTALSDACVNWGRSLVKLPPLHAGQRAV